MNEHAKIDAMILRKETDAEIIKLIINRYPKRFADCDRETEILPFVIKNGEIVYNEKYENASFEEVFTPTWELKKR